MNAMTKLGVTLIENLHNYVNIFVIECFVLKRLNFLLNILHDFIMQVNIVIIKLLLNNQFW